MRVNPRLRVLKSIYKTHLDVLHVKRDENAKLFSLSADRPEALHDCFFKPVRCIVPFL